jgi:hypothetical protein
MATQGKCSESTSWAVTAADNTDFAAMKCDTLGVHGPIQGICDAKELSVTQDERCDLNITHTSFAPETYVVLGITGAAASASEKPQTVALQLNLHQTP